MRSVAAAITSLLAVAAALAVACSAQAPGTRRADADAAGPDGFDVLTFAAPPDVTYPTGLSVAPTGEVYVSVDLNSSLDREPGNGRVVRCVDEDGDGRADRFTDFVPDVDSPRGSCFVGGTLYLVHPPYLSAFRDTDGDGVADEHTVLVERLGFTLKERGADHTSNGVRMGIDGWLYLAIGDYGMVGARGRDGATLQLDGGGVVRVRPDGSGLELHTAHTRNIVDVAVSPRLDLFARDNTNDGKGWNTRFHHLLPLADMGYPRLYKNFADEHLPSLADYGGGSGTAGYFLDEPGIGADWNERVFTGDFTTSRVYAHRMERAGATFRLVGAGPGQEQFLVNRAVDLDVDGRSRIYVCDWSGGGYRYGRPDVGSVTLLRPRGAARPAFPDLGTLGTDALLDAVVSDSAVLRINAQAEILRRGVREDTVRGLRARLVGGALDGRIAALFTLALLERSAGTTRTLVGLAGAESGGALREFALRALADRPGEAGADAREDGGAVSPVTAVFVDAVDSEDPRVVLQAVVGLARLGAREHAARILPLAVPAPESAAAHERALPHVAAKALVRLHADEACLRALDDPRLRPAALRVLRELHTEVAVGGLIERLGAADGGASLRELFAVLCRLHCRETPRTGWKWWGTRPDDRGPYFWPQAWEQTPRIRAALDEALRRMDAETLWWARATLVRNRVDLDGLLVESLDQVAMVLEAVLDAGEPLPEWAVPVLRDAAMDPDRDVAVRVRAFEALRRSQARAAVDAQFVVAGRWFADERGTAELAAAADEFSYSTQLARSLDAVARRLDRGQEARMRCMVLLNLQRSPLVDERVRARLEEIVRKEIDAPAMLWAVAETGRLEHREAVVRAAGSEDPGTRRAAEAALARLDELARRQREVADELMLAVPPSEAFELLMTTRGDADRGREVFQRAACISCHALSQDEVQRGPYLGEVGGKFDRRYLIESLLEPGKVVAQGFQTRWFDTRDGRRTTGFVTAEDDAAVEVRDIAGGVQRIRRRDVTGEGTLPGSMMPPGLLNVLTVREAASLIDFLQSRH